MLFRKKMAKSCEYCAHGVCLDDTQVLCAKKGIRALPGKCGRFRYDPTKRIPSKPRAVDFDKFDTSDFSL